MINAVFELLCFLLFSVYEMQCRHGLKICHLLVLLYQNTFPYGKVILYSLTSFNIALTFHTLAISTL